MIRIVRASHRFRTSHDGIESWHCFAAGQHYDPANLSHGDLIGVDEHLVAPGAGFDWHAHRGVLIASWVLSGALRHQDDRGGEQVVEPGRLFRQDASAGLRHRETCASNEALRLVQLTALTGSFDVRHSAGALNAAQWHLFVARGAWTIAKTVVREGDSVRGEGAVEVAGSGELLVWTS